MGFSAGNVQELEKHLADNPYFSQGGLPTHVDAQIFFDLKECPEVDKTPNLHYWYKFMYTFSNDLMKKWIQKGAPKKEKTEKEKVEKVEKKDAKKQQGDDLFDEAPKKTEGDDLFDDAPTDKPKEEVKKPEIKKKKAVIAKSIVVFDVKIYQTDTDLDVLAKKILALQIDGLVWNKEPKKLPVAYDIQKLQIGCVIEDSKVLTDDIFEKIEEWEEVQSVDMVSMQKL